MRQGMQGEWRARKTARAVLCAAVVLLAGLLSEAPRAASLCGADGRQPGGAVYRICMPSPGAWNGDLVIWAHGYVDITQPVAIPESQLCLGDGFCIPTIVNGLGFGFATTSYRTNGLVTTPVEDVAELIDLFAAEQGSPRRVFVVGASEGGLATALALERRPDLFAGGVAACGPIGDFVRQVEYYGDFRVAFDYFFPGLIPGTLLDVPPDLIDHWDDFWENTVRPVVFDPANAGKLSQLLKVAKAPYDPGVQETIEKTVRDGVWYNVFAATDLYVKLGGSPFDNTGKVYMGSWNDRALNAGVARYTADPAALAAVDTLYTTTGHLDVPMVSLHTTRDQQVAFVQELLYAQKVRAAGSTANHLLIPSFRYGHCNFKPWEAILAFVIAVRKAGGVAPTGVEALLPPADRDAYTAAAREAGLPR
jgi:pimeloyl-ACP methyl ester carboxylesterase